VSAPDAVSLGYALAGPPIHIDPTSAGAADDSVVLSDGATTPHRCPRPGAQFLPEFDGLFALMAVRRGLVWRSR